MDLRVNSDDNIAIGLYTSFLRLWKISKVMFAFPKTWEYLHSVTPGDLNTDPT